MPLRRRLLVPYVTALALAAAAATAAPETSGLPLPRFVSLRADEANLRTGPGTRYPVEWVYQRSALPLEVINEYRHWRKVRDWQGDEGWIHKTLLTARRTAVVVGGDCVMRADPTPGGRIVARLEPGVVGRVVGCPAGGGACRFAVDGYEGWVARDDLWGVYPDEAVE